MSSVDYDGIMLDFISPCGQYKLTFDDDGKVAYAYLKENGNIIADVWLYNRCKTPKVPEWTDRSKIPFANSEGYILPEGKMEDTVSINDVLVDWDDNDSEIVAYIYVFEDLFGVIGPGDKPGYARYASKNSRLARVMNIE